MRDTFDDIEEDAVGERDTLGERVAAAGLGDVEPLRDAVRVVETLRVAVPER